MTISMNVRAEAPLANFMQRKQPWVPRSACLRMLTIPPLGIQVPIPPDVFFPNDAEYAAAKSVCKLCPVRSECLADAMEEERGRPLGMRHGMRAGTTPGQRFTLAETGRITTDN